MGVPYALIGAVAVAIHMRLARATLRVGIAIPAKTDIDALLSALREVGFKASKRFAHSVNLRHRSGEPLQLALDPLFDGPIERAETFAIGKTRLRVVRRADRIALKERAASDPKRRGSKALRDRADLEMLRGDVPDLEEGW